MSESTPDKYGFLSFILNLKGEEYIEDRFALFRFAGTQPIVAPSFLLSISSWEDHPTLPRPQPPRRRIKIRRQQRRWREESLLELLAAAAAAAAAALITRQSPGLM